MFSADLLDGISDAHEVGALSDLGEIGFSDGGVQAGCVVKHACDEGESTIVSIGELGTSGMSASISPASLIFVQDSSTVSDKLGLHLLGGVGLHQADCAAALHDV